LLKKKTIEAFVWYRERERERGYTTKRLKIYVFGNDATTEFEEVAFCFDTHYVVFD